MEDKLVPALFIQQFILNSEANQRLGPSSLNYPIFFKCGAEVPDVDLNVLASQLASRHDILNTRVEMIDNLPHIRFAEGIASLDLIEIQKTEDSIRIENICSELSAIRHRQFNLELESPVRIIKIKTRYLGTIYGVIIHHFAYDLDSLRILENDLRRILQGESFLGRGKEQRSNISFEQYVRKIKNLSQDAGASLSRDFWSKKISNRQTSCSAAIGDEPSNYSRSMSFPFDEGGKILSLKSRGFPISLIFIASNIFAFSSVGGLRELSIECIVSGRTSPEYDGIVGCLIDTVPIMVEFQEDFTYLEFLSLIRRYYAQSLSNMSISFAEFAETLKFRNRYTPIINWNSRTSEAEGSDFPIGIGECSVEPLQIELDGGDSEWKGTLECPYVIMAGNTDRAILCSVQGMWMKKDMVDLMVEKMEMFLNGLARSPNAKIVW